MWHGREYPGEGNGNPLQYSCLENHMDRGAWLAAVHGVTKSRIQLSDFTFTFHFHALEKEMATHSSVLAWRTPGTREPDGLRSMGLHRVGHNWRDLAAAAAAASLSSEVTGRVITQILWLHMTEFLFHRNKNTVPISTGFQLQNSESNYLTQQKPNSALFLFSISNSECESDSHQKCDKNRRGRNRFTYSFTAVEAESVLWKIQQDVPHFPQPLFRHIILWGSTPDYFAGTLRNVNVYISF